MNQEDDPVIKAAQDYLYGPNQYASMQQIGKILGISSHAVGRKLKELGFRTPDGDPTDMAKESGLTRAQFVEQGYWLNLWHQDRVLAVLSPHIVAKKGTSDTAE